MSQVSHYLLDVELSEENRFYIVDMQVIKKDLSMFRWGSCDLVLLQIVYSQLLSLLLKTIKAGLFHFVMLNSNRNYTGLRYSHCVADIHTSL